MVWWTRQITNIYIYTVISQGTSLKNTPTSHAVSLALFMHACSDSANMLLCHALAYANGFCLHLLLVHGGVKKVFLMNCMQLQGPHKPHRLPYICVSLTYDKYSYIYRYFIHCLFAIWSLEYCNNQSCSKD